MNATIRRRLLLWLSPALLVAGLAFAVPTWLNVHEEIDELFDKVLREAAHSQQAAFAGDYPARPKPPPLPGKGIDLVTQVWGADGRLVYRSHSFEPLPRNAEEGWSTLAWRGAGWRVFTAEQAGGMIQIAQSLAERRETAREIALHLLAPLWVLLPGLAFLAWLALGRGLRPLRNVVAAVRARTPDDLAPIPGAGLPHEVGALVAAINDLLGRLDGALAAQRQFTADAAHELRTPLTALSLQAQVAERATDPAKQAAALATLRQGIARASHLVQQLLTLARLDPEAGRTAPTPLRLDALAEALVAERAPLADLRGIDLVAASSGCAWIAGNADALRILLGNLLDNALRYTPTAGRVEVEVKAEGDGIRLIVRDTGPGIPPEERQRVFDRFYRGADQTEPGSGLGLAIVRRIADRHGAAIHLGESEEGQGLAVSVVFPACRTQGAL